MQELLNHPASSFWKLIERERDEPKISSLALYISVNSFSRVFKNQYVHFGSYIELHEFLNETVLYESYYYNTYFIRDDLFVILQVTNNIFWSGFLIYGWLIIYLVVTFIIVTLK